MVSAKKHIGLMNRIKGVFTSTKTTNKTNKTNIRLNNKTLLAYKTKLNKTLKSKIYYKWFTVFN